MTEVTAVTNSVIDPDLGFKIAVFKYTKGASGDVMTLTQAAEDARGTTGITYKYGVVMSNILFATAMQDTGVIDPATYTGGVLTFTIGTGASTALVIGY